MHDKHANGNLKLNNLHLQIGIQLATIRHLRREKQINVANATGISAATISKIETGKYSRLSTVLMAKLADYYETDVTISFL